MKNEIILYYLDNQPDFHLEVMVEDETVWLTQAQMVELFDATKQNISLHIKNIFKEEELDEKSTVKEYLTVQLEGSRKVKRKICTRLSFKLRFRSYRATLFQCFWKTSKSSW